MQTTGSVKVGAAFVAGVMLALGGAVLYFRASDHARPAAAIVEKDESKPAELEPAPEAEPTPAPNHERPMVAAVVAKPKARKPHITSRPVSLALLPQQSDPVTQPPPMPPMDAPAPSPAVTAQALSPEPEPAPPQPIPAGTNIAIRLNEKISTDGNFTGDTFRASLDAPIVMGGFIIADRGAKVLGRIVKAQKPGKLEGMAELSLVLTEVSTTDGQKMAIETNQSLRKGASNTNEEVIKMAGGAALGAIIGALAGGGRGAAIGAGAGGAAGTGAVLLGKGKAAVIENETRLTFELTNPITITEHLN
jgi:hypothetical protein